uniref:C40 family peptidase n=1 Tax=Agathobacter sp. TaxID=2021311 RepID=UPI0040568BF8
MNLNKRLVSATAIAATLGVLFAGASVAPQEAESANADCQLQVSAGAIAHIEECSYTHTAGAAAAVFDENIEVVDLESVTVGQAAVEYDTFGYTNLGLAVVDGNLNVRESAGPDASIVGKMTNYAACEVLGTEGEWTKITSGNVEGYVKSEYLITGEEALVIAQDEAGNMATVNADTLRVREAASTDSKTLSTVSNEEELVVAEVLDGWVKVEVDNYEGYVSADYVSVEKKLKTGNTLKELAYGEGVSDVRVSLVNYALQFVGNRYVWGGTSLTNGVDCSGFTMRVYQQYGISLPHHSGSQPSHGTKISRDEIRPGDLIFYGNGSGINHVAIYIGNGQVVHASNARDGIKISKAFYRTPVCIVSYLP